MDDRAAVPPPWRRRSAPATVTLALVLLVLAVLAGCGGSSGHDSSSSSAEGRSDALAGLAAPAVPAAPAGTTTLGIGNRALVYSGEMSLTTKEVSAAAQRVSDTAQAAGGYVAADVRSFGERPTVQLTLRLPSAKFTKTVDDVARLGTEISRRLGTDDKQVAAIDLNAQIASQRASVNRIRTLLSQAKTLEELTRIEAELTTRQTALASSEASRRGLADEVSLSTLVVSLALPADAAKPEEKTDLGLLVGLRYGWRAFVLAIGVTFTVVGWLLPFALLAVVLVAPFWWWRRTHSRSRPLAPAGPELTAEPDKTEPDGGGKP